jgi:hypothetical protein
MIELADEGAQVGVYDFFGGSDFLELAVIGWRSTKRGAWPFPLSGIATYPRNSNHKLALAN